MEPSTDSNEDFAPVERALHRYFKEQSRTAEAKKLLWDQILKSHWPSRFVVLIHAEIDREDWSERRKQALKDEIQRERIPEEDEVVADILRE